MHNNTWTRAPLRDLLSQHFPGAWGNDPRETNDFNVLILRSTNLDDDGHVALTTGAPRRISSMDLANKRLQDEDILLEASGGGPGKPVGRVALFRQIGERVYACSNFFRTLRFDRRFAEPSFMAWALHWLHGQPDIMRYQQQTTGIINLRYSDYLDHEILLPSMDEQRRIADVLDSVDEQIDVLERLIAKLNAALYGMTDKLIGYDLDGGSDTLRRGRFGDFIRLQRGFDITAAEQQEGRVPVVSSSGITSYHDTAMVKGPGVVIGRKGKLGNAYYIDCDFWPHDTSLWVTDFRGNDPEFITYFLKWLRLERLDAATSVPTLNRNFVHQIPVAIPGVAEQQRIVGEIKAWEHRIQREKEELAKLRLLKQGLMNDLLMGRVRVPIG